jgi:IS30 family transposase
MLTPKQRNDVQQRLKAKESVSSIARALGTSRQTIMRLRNAV